MAAEGYDKGNLFAKIIAGEIPCHKVLYHCSFSGHECSSFAHYTMLASSAGAHKIERVRQVFETEHALAILDAFPTREGHCLLLPKVCFSFLCIGVTSVGRIFDCGGSLCASSDVFQSHNLLAWCPHSKKHPLMFARLGCQGETVDVRDMSEDLAAKALSALPKLTSIVTKATG